MNKAQIAYKIEEYAKSMQKNIHIPVMAGTKADDVIGDTLRLRLKQTGHSDNVIDDATALYLIFGKWILAKTVYTFEENLSTMLGSTEDTMIRAELLCRLPYGSFLVFCGEEAYCCYIEAKSDEVLVAIAPVKLEKSELSAQQCAIWFKDGLKISDAVKAVSNDTDRDYWLDKICRLMNYIYFLAAKNAEIRKSKYKKHIAIARDGSRRKVSIREWDVSYRVGDPFPQEPHGSASGNITGNTLRPHMRRAHWHHYHTGKGGENLELRWIAPVMVHGGAVVPAVEHKVNSRKLEKHIQ